MNLALRGLSKGFAGRSVFDGIDLAFPPGAVTAVLGINGAGKTTLLRCLSGLSQGDAGEVLMDGEALRTGRLDLRRRLLFLTDQPPAFPGTDVLENAAAHLRLWEADRAGVEEVVARLVSESGLSREVDRPVESLSRGQQWKAALIALAAVDPELWLLDEPFASGMDARGLSLFRKEATAAAQRGRTVIYTTQIPELAAAFADAVALVGGGAVRLLDPDNDFGRDPQRLEGLILAAGA